MIMIVVRVSDPIFFGGSCAPPPPPPQDDVENHEHRACAAALAMSREIDRVGCTMAETLS